MNRTCVSCGADAVVLLIDKRIEQRVHVAGNKFRSFCKACETWNPLVKRAEFILDLHDPERECYILPVDTDDPESFTSLVPVSEYDGEIEELEALKSDPSVSENRFICPAEGCTAENTGQPDACQSCEAEYVWPEKKDETTEATA